MSRCGATKPSQSSASEGKDVRDTQHDWPTAMIAPVSIICIEQIHDYMAYITFHEYPPSYRASFHLNVFSDYSAFQASIRESLSKVPIGARIRLLLRARLMDLPARGSVRRMSFAALMV